MALPYAVLRADLGYQFHILSLVIMVLGSLKLILGELIAYSSEAEKLYKTGLLLYLYSLSMITSY